MALRARGYTNLLCGIPCPAQFVFHIWQTVGQPSCFGHGCLLRLQPGKVVLGGTAFGFLTVIPFVSQCWFGLVFVKSLESGTPWGYLWPLAWLGQTLLDVPFLHTSVTLKVAQRDILFCWKPRDQKERNFKVLPGLYQPYPEKPWNKHRGSTRQPHLQAFFWTCQCLVQILL